MKQTAFSRGFMTQERF